jgi:signal transduction histidine kinase
LSIRRKLLAMVLLPLAVVLPLLGVLLLWWGNVAFDRLLITKVRADLAVANGYFERVLGEVGAGTLMLAQSHALHRALERGSSDADLVPLLQRWKEQTGLDFVNLRAPDGGLRATDSGLATTTDRASPAFIAVGSGSETTSVELLSPRQLGLLSAELRERVPVRLVETRNAAPRAAGSAAVEDRAMVLLSTRAVRAADGKLLGHVQGGVLLNRNLPFIDHINQIVYPAGSLPFGSQGTATLFLDDVRISTNVRLFGAEKDERAIGTRVSRTVRDAVLERGSTWLDRAFVVSDWYVSGYQPLENGRGQRIGMLYVGFLERPFTLLKYGILAAIGVVFFAVMIGAAVISLRGARAVFGPIERMEATMRRVEGGELDARVGPIAQRRPDEIGRLAGHLDELLATQQRWHGELDAKVAERTRQLEEAQAQLVRSEKLATVGQLTASIAHEVNNPIAVIQGNLDLVRELLPADARGRVEPELKLVDEQIERMRLIVTQLLQFARPTEFAGYVERVDPVRAVEDCLVLVAHLLARTQIVVQRELAPVPPVAINRQELQQVLVNLMVNAIHAMAEGPDGGGTLVLSTRVSAADGLVEIGVADSGPGLTPDVLAQLFQPFVTRKKDGTGLGLWISRSIVERYGGDIVANNRDGVRGACFTVRCKADAGDAADTPGAP